MDDQQIITEFVASSREHLADIESRLLAIEAAGVDADIEMVNTVFRAVHSIKGAAGFLGFSTVSGLAQDLENVLIHVRDRRLAPDAAVTDVLLRSADKLRSLLDDIDHSDRIDVSEHLDALQRIVAGLLAEELAAPAGRLAAIPAETPASVAAASAELANASPAGAEGQGRPAENAALPPAAAGAPPAESSIRVAVSVLDRLMNLAGELVLARNQLLQAASDDGLPGPAAARINQVTSELQEAIMQTRLQPMGTVFSRFPRFVRDLSNALGKQCQLTIEGQEVELDKSIIEAVADPLTHLVRNAVDHGIEPPEARLRSGKPAVGTLTLRAFHQSGKVHIQICDDGQGIDAGRLREQAAAKGLITSEQARAMSDREALRLIFRPGFSMAEKVTSVSGRGVGMDVVKTNIERLGGTVAVETRSGAGTAIRVSLPLTLAIVPSLVVRCAAHRYALPRSSIRELIRVKASEAASRIDRVHSAEVFRFRGDLLPLVRLNRALSAEAQDGAEAQDVAAERALNIIVVETGGLRYGLIVDGLCDSEEIVVKPLGRHLKGCACLAGATILGDGSVALILDVAGIAAHSRLALLEEETASEAAQACAEELQALLLFQNHSSECFAVPMESVARIERIRADRIDSAGGRKAIQYRGGTLPLLRLEEHLACKPAEESRHVYVAVFTAAQREVGLLMPRLLDIRALSTQVDAFTFREPGVAGSVVHEQMTVRILNLQELVRKARPDWCVAAPAAAGGTRSRLLLAEDSTFFRKQLTGLFESEGYEVVACEDGAAAWSELQTPGSRFDLLVTDIEMPNMDGLTLTGRIRADSRLSAMPIIAVTSLAGEEDYRRAQQAAVSEYLIKLDRDQLLSAVARLCRPAGSETGKGITP